MTKPVRTLEVETLPISLLRPSPHNASVHSTKQIARIAKSMCSFGWTLPILADAKGEVIAGHARLEAANLLGFMRVPVIRIGDMSPTQVRAYRIADNRLAEDAEWNREKLSGELKDLIDMSSEIEITDTGFEMAEIDLIIGDGEESRDGDEALDEADIEGPSIARRGDLWLLGPSHRLLCGDALNADDYARLLGGEQAELGFTDPPYNLKIAGHVSGLGRKTHREFEMASGEMASAEFKHFLLTSFSHMAANSVAGAIHFIFMDWRHAEEIIAAGHAAFSELKNLCVWDKQKGGMGSLYRSAHELVFVFKSGKAPHINNVALGAYGRNRTNVWNYAGVNSFGAGRDHALEMHPTTKPVALVADAILDCSNRRGIVLDPFAGSGTTIIAAERTGRRARAMEIDPRYVDVALRRFWRLTGIEPVDQRSGQPFGELEVERRCSSESADSLRKLEL